MKGKKMRILRMGNLRMRQKMDLEEAVVEIETQ